MAVNMSNDIRWLQRYANFRKALRKLEAALEVKTPSELERAGIIQMFEFTTELAWNTLKDLLEYQGENGIIGSREAINLAFQKGIIRDGEAWLGTLKSRNLSSHTYQESVAIDIENLIRSVYYQLFADLNATLQSIADCSNE